MKNVENIYPLTPAQAGMLFHCIKDQSSGYYINQFSCQISGDFKPNQFKNIWEKVVQHFPVLRTAFVWEAMDEPLQVVRQKVDLYWLEKDLQNLSSKEFQNFHDKYVADQHENGFELSKAPLMRFALFQTNGDIWQFVWTCHHLLVDGWTMHMVLNNVFDGYETIVKDSPLSLMPSRPFSDYIAWLQEQDQKAAESFWKKTLKGFNSPTSLSAFSHKSNQKGSATFIHHLTIIETNQLKEYAKENRLTLNTLVQAAWALLLGRFSGENDVVYGATVSGRPPQLPGIETLAGMCINTLPMRVKIPLDLTVEKWLTQLQKSFMSLRDYEYSSLVDVQGWSDIPRGQAMFDSILVFENYPLNKTEIQRSIEISDRQYIEKSNFPLAILAIPAEALQFMNIYDSALFSEESMARLTNYLQTILAHLVKLKSELVGSIPILSRMEEQQLIESATSQKLTKRTMHLVHQQIEEQSAKTPDETAVVYEGHSLTYQQLNRRANQLAHHLISQKIKADTPIGIYLERSLEMVVAILAVIKSGGAYLPLDPTYPKERIDFMVEDAKCPLIISEDHLAGQLSDYNEKLVLLKQRREILNKNSVKNPGINISSEQLIYVIYTSGSTGKPKGVMVTHSNLYYSTQARLEYYKTPIERYLLLSSFSFDSSVAAIFWTLCQGGMLCLPSQKNYNNPEYLASLIAEKQISHLLAIPSLFGHLLENFDSNLTSLKTAIVAGETCSKDLLNEHKAKLPSTELFNEYGPTEATVWSTVFDCQNDLLTPMVPIGKTIPGMQVYILDNQLRLLPVGVSGEIFLGGEGISRGYLNQPELTARKFILNPFDKLGKTRLYKTGDLGKWLADGNIEFFGRNDRQIKLRGFRIEIGEIESVLKNHPGVEEVAVLVNKHNIASASTTRITHKLAENLSELDSKDAENLLAEISNMSEAQINNSLTDVDQVGDINTLFRKIENEDLSIQVNVKRDTFIAPPRDAQRQWLISQAVNEFHDDLTHLDSVAKIFVSGTTADVEFDISQSKMSQDRIMENWQIPVMKAMAEKVSAGHGDVLEIGFGRGISAGFIQGFGVKSHTIVEMNLECIKDHFEPWHKKYPDKNIRLIEGRWQDVLENLGTYDGVFFHAFPMNEKEFMEYVVDSVTFAEHFFPVAAKLLKKRGVFSYLTTEIDSLSRRHQRALFKYFSEISLSVQPLSIPENTIDTWWADKMVIIKAVKG